MFGPAFGIIYIIITLIGEVGNVIVLFVIFTEKKLQTLGNVMIAILTINDMFLIILDFGYPIMECFFQINFLQTNYLGCAVYGILYQYFQVASVYSMAAIGLNRYTFVCHQQV